MIVPISPPLQGIAAERFLNLARALNHAAERNHEPDRQTLLHEEIAWMRAHLTEDSPTAAAYEAAVRVLIDLERLGWQIREEGYGLELVAERPRRRSLTPEQIGWKEQDSSHVPPDGSGAVEGIGSR
ncbi:MAG: hypothetical protein HC889_01965 [Synechococcaceae cyanobacterium SM1_2_3]|nr:hypothetical protein [Synechococcaceae cyanobacterium SM1_2_3]